MGFLDNVKDALKDAVSTQASKDEEAKDEAAMKDDVVVEKADTTTADDSATPAPPTIPIDTDTPDAETAEPTTEPTTGPVQPADSVEPAPTTPVETAEEKAARQEAREDRQERKEDRQEAREDAREKREDAREAKFETYTVKSGDTLGEIGARFGVSYQEIAKLNSIENPDLIFPGQVFRIPKN
ncbi:MAG: LysM peptidoglycan-binding domain-containing protein [Nocardioides sp.]|uniref:LysM peptidoglycan-binding domain-containing protein n=1 Tax=Nocardioides sp. TaxID=35761 RepID=UPI003267A427